MAKNYAIVDLQWYRFLVKRGHFEEVPEKGRIKLFTKKKAKKLIAKNELEQAWAPGRFGISKRRK